MRSCFLGVQAVKVTVKISYVRNEPSAAFDNLIALMLIVCITLLSWKRLGPVGSPFTN